MTPAEGVDEVRAVLGGGGSVLRTLAAQGPRPPCGAATEPPRGAAAPGAAATVRGGHRVP
eukprot:gene50053-34234_t